MDCGFAMAASRNIFISSIKVCVLSRKKLLKKMPYARKSRGSATRKPSITKRGRKITRSLNSKPGFVRSLIAKTRAKPYGVNMGNALHVDRIPAMSLRHCMPARLYTKLRYVDNFLLSADNLTGLTGTEIPYRLNSLFDPYFLAGGHQPLGYDQLTPLYSRYKVFKVDIQVALRGRTGSGLPYVAINLRNAASTYVLSGLKALAEILEQPGNTVLDGLLPAQTWNQTVWMHEVEGRTFEEYMAEDGYGALNSTNPALTPYLSVACGTVDTPASSATGAYVTVAFVFHAYFYEPSPLNQS